VIEDKQGKVVNTFASHSLYTCTWQVRSVKMLTDEAVVQTQAGLAKRLKGI
jgi:hypothetical protein